MIEAIRGAHLAPRRAVRGPHVFTPPDDLPHKSLKRRERGGGVGSAEHHLHDLARVQESNVQSGCEQAVIDEWMLGRDGVLVGTEIIEPFRRELVQVPTGFVVGCRPREQVGVARSIRKRIDHPRDGVIDVSRCVGSAPVGLCVELHQGVKIKRSLTLENGMMREEPNLRRCIPARKLFAVVGVEGPLAADGLAILGHQDSQPPALPGIEVLHARRVLREPVVDLRAVGQKVRCFQHDFGAHAIPAVAEARDKIFLQPVIHHIEHGDLSGLLRTNKLGELAARAAIGVTRKNNNLVPVLAQATRKADHGCSVQHQLVRVEPVLAKHQIVLDEHKHGAVGCLEMLLKELMGKDEAYALAASHAPTIGAKVRAERTYSRPSSSGMSIVRKGPAFAWRPQMRSATSSIPLGS